MKKSILIITTAILGLTSCSSDDEIVKQDFSNDILGTWVDYSLTINGVETITESEYGCSLDEIVFKKDLTYLSRELDVEGCKPIEDLFTYSLTDNILTSSPNSKYSKDFTISELSATKLVLKHKEDYNGDGTVDDLKHIYYRK